MKYIWRNFPEDNSVYVEVLPNFCLKRFGSHGVIINQYDDDWLELTRSNDVCHITNSTLPSHSHARDLTSLPSPIFLQEFNVAAGAGSSFLAQQSIASQNDTNNSRLNYSSLPGIAPDQNYPNYLDSGAAELFKYQNSFQNTNANFQSHDDQFENLDMSTRNADIDPRNELAEVVEANTKTPLRCRFPDCPEDREFFTESALRKHEGKHNKPYTCNVLGCKHPRFGDKGGLDRHRREVHGDKTHCCPIPSCRRHIKGFPRKYNLFKHQKLWHPGQSPNSALAVIRTSEARINLEGEGMEEVQVQDEEASSPEMTITSDLTVTGNGKVQEKLRELLALRAEIDLDIEALKRAMNILEGSSL